MEEQDKKIDSAWKESVEKEKSAPPAGSPADEFVPPQPTFTFFIATLGVQASIFLGDIPSPVSNKPEVDLKQARFLIDTLDMIKEKTKGNLDKEEGDLLENLLYELRLRYVQKNQPPAGK